MLHRTPMYKAKSLSLSLTLIILFTNIQNQDSGTAQREGLGGLKPPHFFLQE